MNICPLLLPKYRTAITQTTPRHFRQTAATAASITPRACTTTSSRPCRVRDYSSRIRVSAAFRRRRRRGRRARRRRTSSDEQIRLSAIENAQMRIRPHNPGRVCVGVQPLATPSALSATASRCCHVSGVKPSCSASGRRARQCLASASGLNLMEGKVESFGDCEAYATILSLAACVISTS